MAIVVESTSTASGGTGSGVTITKPTGLAEGDLMVAILSCAEGDDSGIGDWNTAAGWTDVESNQFFGGVSQSVQYKIADSGDVAASNFSFSTTASSNNNFGSILRCSGAATDVSGSDALGDSSTYSNASADSNSFIGTLTPYTPQSDGALVIAMYGLEWDIGGGARTWGSQSVSNVTSVTELYDNSPLDGSGGVAFCAVYGVQATAAELSTYSATITEGSSEPGGNEHFGTFVVFIAPVDASGSNDLTTTTTTTFAQTGTCDTIGSNVLAEATAEALPQTGQATSPTQWANEAKPSTTWVNESK